MPENSTIDQTQIDPTTTLSDGRVVVMRETNGDDDYTVEKLLAKEGLTPSGFGGLAYMRMLSLNAIDSVGGAPLTPIYNFNDLRMRQASFKSKDLTSIMSLYKRVNMPPDAKDIEGNV